MMLVSFLLLALPVSLVAESLTLEQCVARALRSNVDVRVAEQSVVRSVADLKASRAERLPSANATLLNMGRSRSGSAVRIRDNPIGVDPVTGDRIFREEKTVIPAANRNSFSVGAALNHTLYDAGRRASGYRSSKHRMESAEFSLKSRQTEVVATVKRRYYELLKAMELVGVQEESVGLAEKQLEDAQARLEVGSGTEVDVLRLEVAKDNAQAELINVRQQVALAKAQLNHVMGDQLGNSLKVAPLAQEQWQMPVVADELEQLLEEAYAANPALQSQRQTIVAAEHDVKAAQAAWYPRLEGRLGYSRDNEVFDRVYENLDQNYSLNVGLTLSYELFDGGARQANVDRSRVALETARMNADQQQRDTALALETSRLELVRLEKILRLGEQTVKLAQEDLRLAEERYRVGKGRLLEVLDAQVGFIRERGNLVRTRYDLKITEADLKRQLGSR